MFRFFPSHTHTQTEWHRQCLYSPVKGGDAAFIVKSFGFCCSLATGFDEPRIHPTSICHAVPCEKTNTNTVTNTSTNTSTNTFPLQRCPCKQSQSASKKTKYGKLSPPPRTPYQSAAFKCKPDPKPAPETESEPATGWRRRSCSLLV